MKQFPRRVRLLIGRTFFDSRIIVGTVGLFLSIVLHELFHMLVHWGNITYIHIFPNHQAIVEIGVTTSASYDPLMEEVVAYGIMLISMFVTVVIIFSYNDKKDTKTFRQSVFPKNKYMQKLPAQELYDLAMRTGIFR